MYMCKMEKADRKVEAIANIDDDDDKNTSLELNMLIFYCLFCSTINLSIAPSPDGEIYICNVKLNVSMFLVKAANYVAYCNSHDHSIYGNDGYGREWAREAYCCDQECCIFMGKRCIGLSFSKCEQPETRKMSQGIVKVNMAIRFYIINNLYMVMVMPCAHTHTH